MILSTLLFGALACQVAAQSGTGTRTGAGASTEIGTSFVAGTSMKASSSAPLPSATAGEGGETSGEGICGLGYTYCGYILKNNNEWSDVLIEKAFCAGKGNCPDGTAKSSNTSMLGALYICLPADAKPQPKLMAKMRRETGVPTPTAVAPTGTATNTEGPKGGGRDFGYHKLELLCACGGDPDPQKTCLNPEGDHIGRCATPCHNSCHT